MKICCITGHRNIPAGKTAFVGLELHKLIDSAINDGFTHFISGFADGVDTLFAEIVTVSKDANPNITLEAAIPNSSRLLSSGSRFQYLLDRCDEVTIISKEYDISCYMKRNKYMVDKSQLVLAVYDGRKTGGTVKTLRYARKADRQVRVIFI